MMKASLSLVLLGLAATAAPAQVRTASPDGRNQVTVEIRDGKLYYSLQREGRSLLTPSLLGFQFRLPFQCTTQSWNRSVTLSRCGEVYRPVR